MPNSTFSQLTAYDRQGTLMDCYSSVIDLVVSSKDLQMVSRDNLALLLDFLHRELITDDCLNFRNRSDSDRQDLYFSCQTTVTNLMDHSCDLQQVERDSLYLLLNFLHDELMHINEIINLLSTTPIKTSPKDSTQACQEIAEQILKASGDNY